MPRARRRRSRGAVASVGQTTSCTSASGRKIAVTPASSPGLLLATGLLAGVTAIFLPEAEVQLVV